MDLAILGLLEDRGELHGYEIRRQLRSGLGLLANVSFGSLYPALARLEAAGAVVAVEVVAAAADSPDQEVGGGAVPLTGSLSGEWAVLRARRQGPRRTHARRSRKVYRITETGRVLFGHLLEGSGTADDPRSFGLRLTFARHMPQPARLALLERRRLQLSERLDEVRSAGDDDLDVYARTVVEHTAGTMANDIGWLDRLIEAERSATRDTPGRDTEAPGAETRTGVA